MFAADARDAHDALHVLAQQQAAISTNTLKQFPAQHVLRIFQIDAWQLEAEVTAILKSGLNQVVSVGPFEMLRFRYADELELLLRVVLFKFGLWDRNQMVWDRMQNLVYRNEREYAAASPIRGTPLAVVSSARLRPTVWQKICWLLLSVLAPYVGRKLLQRAQEENWRVAASAWKRWAVRLLDAWSRSWKFVELLHWLWFLMEGKYRSVVDRVLGMRLVHGDLVMARLVNLVYLNQHVAWTSWTSVLNVVLPLLRVGQAWDNLNAVGGSMLTNVGHGGSAALRDGFCCACREAAVMGRKSNCGHLYCYYCIASRLAAGHGSGDSEPVSFPCLQCGSSVQRML